MDGAVMTWRVITGQNEVKNSLVSTLLATVR